MISLIIQALLLLVGISLGEDCIVSKTSRSYLNETFAKSQILISATVERITIAAAEDGIAQNLTLKVKRTFKGREHIGSSSSIEVIVPHHFWVNTRSCLTALLLHDTRIFAISVRGNNLEIVPPIIRINLSVLDALHSFTMGKPHRKRRKSKPSLCETKLCPLGSKCVFSTGECECRNYCRTGAAVCGSDRVSYASSCHLYVRACLLAKKGEKLRIMEYGACSGHNNIQETKLPPVMHNSHNLTIAGPKRRKSDSSYILTDGITKTIGNQFIGVDRNGHPAKFTCRRSPQKWRKRLVLTSHQRCLFNSSTLVRLEIGLTMVQMLAALLILCPYVFACYRYPKGQKSPCEDLRCGPGEDCVVSQKDGVLSAQCVCPQSCPSYGDSVESSPVCSSQGIDYPSWCHLKQHACHAQINITVRYFGECDPCSGILCARGTSCKLNADRQPECRCSEQCALTYDPVCADNGLTYANECVMKVAACKEDLQLSVYKKGKCSELQNPCDVLQCSHHSRCQLFANGTATCVCPQKCPLSLSPVCATDGITYDNECEMHRNACVKQSYIAVRHREPCGEGLCSSFICSAPLVCVVKDEKPTCVCPQCTDELREVCASDGRTYSNECKMRKAACEAGVTLFVKYNGICEGCAKKNCQYYSSCVVENGKAECRCPSDCYSKHSSTQLTPVCGTDGVTYSSECHLRKSACQQMKFIMVAFEGKCDACLNVECGFGQECRGGKCLCSYQCPSAPPPSARVCGEDGVLYSSDCHRQLAACQRGSPIPVLPLIRCHSAVATFNDACQCHSLGSFGPNCDTNGNCRCRAGVGGAKCDHCLPGFWGLHLIAAGAQSCKPCGCSTFGSSRADCEQTTGRCECLHGARGEKCDRCAPDLVMTPPGCMERQEFHAPRSCSLLKCHHGAKCVESAAGLPNCECPEHCNVDHLGIVANMSVCGSDGTTYEDMCQLTQFACKHQLDVVAVSLGICPQDTSGPRERNNRQKSNTTKLDGCKAVNCTDQKTSLNLVMDGQKAYGVELNVNNLPLNLTLTVVPRSSNGVILSAKGDRGEFILKFEMRRIVADFGHDVLYSSERVALGSIQQISLTWQGKTVSLKVGKSATSLSIATEPEPLIKLSIGDERGLSFAGRLVQLSVNGRPLQRSDVTSFSGLGDLYNSPVVLENGSYIELANVNVEVRSKLQVALGFRTSAENGSIFIWCSSTKRKKCATYLALVLRNQQPHLFLDLGSGTVQLSGKPISSRYWTTVKMDVTPSNANVYLNGSLAITKSFKHGDRHLMLGNDSVFLGGVHPDLLPEKLHSYTTPFSGEVKRLFINERPFDLYQELMEDPVLLGLHPNTMEVTNLVHSKHQFPVPLRTQISKGKMFMHAYINTYLRQSLQKSSKSESDVLRYGNGTEAGTGVESEEIFERCCGAKDHIAKKDPGHFDDGAFFNGTHEYAYLNGGNKPIFSSTTSDFSFEFRADSSDGVLWSESEWLGSGRSDFLIIHLRKGKVNVAVNLGNDRLKPVSTNKSIVRGKWHRVSVERREHRTTVNVDGKLTTIISSEGATQLNTNGLVYLGGRLGNPKRFRIKGTFVGCIRRVKINGIRINLLHDVISAQPPLRCHPTLV